MNDLLKFLAKAAASLFALGAGVKLGEDSLKHVDKIKNSKNDPYEEQE